MAVTATTKMSSKGQVIIPEEVRRRLGLGVGAQFVVLGKRDEIILKLISSPSVKCLDRIIKGARKQVRLSDLSRADAAKAVNQERRRR